MSIRLIHGDCLQVLPTLGAKSVDLVLCDPPYGQTQNAWDAAIPFDPMWSELWRVCAGAVVFMAMQPFSSALVMSQVRAFRHEWVWEKNKATGHLNCSKAPLRAHELVLVFSQGQPKYTPQMTEGHAPANLVLRRGHNSPNYGAQRPSASYGGSTARYPRTVQKFAVVNNDSPEKVHPTQKPVDLFEYLIRTYSDPGDVILDFTMGSGTTGVAAKRTGRSFIGIDISAEYVDLAHRRIHGDAGPLFAEAI